MPNSKKTNEQIINEIQQLNEKTDDEQGDPVDKKIEQLKQQLVNQNIGLVKSIASDYLHSGIEFEDLTQAGYLGLLNAAENFDLSRGTKFSTYATYLIKGEIRHHIRDNQPVVHVPQWIKELGREVQKAQQEIYHETGEFPTIKELAEHLNIEEEGVREVLKARDSMTYISIDKKRRNSDPRPEYINYEKIKSKHKEEFPIEYRVRIAEAIEQLSAVQQEVVKGIFYEGETQTEVGKNIGTSQRQVSRIKDRILDEIRDYFEKDSSKKPSDKEQ